MVKKCLFTVIDSLTKESIPFATITTNFKQNSITNEEGVFRLSKETEFTNKDSIFISSIGFKSFADALLKINDSVIFLPQKIIELNNVILTQNNLSAEEIIKKSSAKYKGEVQFIADEKAILYAGFL